MPIVISEHRPLERIRSRDAAPIGASPSPAQLRAILADAGLTQAQAAALCRSSLRGFTQWLLPDGPGSRTMPAASAELLCLAIIASGRLPPGDWCAPWLSADLQRLARRGQPGGHRVKAMGATVGIREGVRRRNTGGSAVEITGTSPP